MIYWIVAGWLVIGIELFIGLVVGWCAVKMMQLHIRVSAKTRAEKALLNESQSKADLESLVNYGWRMCEKHKDIDSKSWCEFRDALRKFTPNRQVNVNDLS